jgi:hypothetical protein
MPSMAERLKRRPRDPLALAKLIGDIATGQTVGTVPDDRNPAAIALGKLGGAKGGKARANKIDASEAAGDCTESSAEAMVKMIATSRASALS